MNKLILIALVALVVCQNKMNTDELAAHNKKRKLHKNTPNLSYCKECYQHAQAYAEKLCKKNSDPNNRNLVWSHSTDRNNMGENMHASWSSSSTATYKAGSATESWCKKLIFFNLF